jgi:hypothetical protein
LTPAERTEINRLTDERWYLQPGIEAGSKIDPIANPEQAKAWIAERNKLLGERTGTESTANPGPAMPSMQPLSSPTIPSETPVGYGQKELQYSAILSEAAYGKSTPPMFERMDEKLPGTKGEHGFQASVFRHKKTDDMYISYVCIGVIYRILYI